MRKKFSKPDMRFAQILSTLTPVKFIHDVEGGLKQVGDDVLHFEPRKYTDELDGDGSVKLEYSSLGAEGITGPGELIFDGWIDEVRKATRPMHSYVCVQDQHRNGYVCSTLLEVWQDISTILDDPDTTLVFSISKVYMTREAFDDLPDFTGWGNH